MVFKKKKKHPILDDGQEIAIIFRKIVNNMQSVYLKLEKEKSRCNLLSDEDGLFVAFPAEDREAHNVRPGQVIPLYLYYEGKEYYQNVKVLGAGKFTGRDALRLEFPAALHINDDFGLTQLHLIPRRDCTFTSMFNHFCDGQVVNIGPKGIDLKVKEEGEIGEYLAVDKGTAVGFELDESLKFNCKGQVLYIRHVGEELVGIEFTDLPDGMEERLAEWIHDQAMDKRTKDMDVFRKKPPAKPKLEQTGLGLRGDFKTVVQEGDPYILILCRDEALNQRLSKCLKRKYGVLVSKGSYANVEKILDHFKPVLVLVHETLGAASGFDLAATMQERLEEPPPMLIIGPAADEGEENEKRLKAVNRGTEDFLLVEPFKMLPVFKKVDDVVNMLTEGLM